ncbi:MAG: bifunctional phosphopantothenoylcysteine decarboxylase/phosphopantothenate--cysteine ligase CoaBC [Gammaproteobacteria bacterium]|nr:bifunctional phosphopantothenoylcysteine decarboxylase/phosphopantothenate--cysteine ligase CoaBC [Gammaproteobacteria bacterium]
MAEQTIVLGITGGIAAYKTPELVRQLTLSGYRVIPVLSKAAENFVTNATLTAVSGEKVRHSLWDADAERAMGHIELARLADLLLVAPATANVIAKFAHGVGDDLLSTIYAATQAPVMLAPAMNQQMYNHVPTQRNLTQLAEDGVQIVGPNSGDQACGETGPGRMSEPHEIVAAVGEVLVPSNIQPTNSSGVAEGIRVLVTAGPTRERIDPVRYLTNASSGRQGFAVAAAAQRIGANVTLISGPVSLDTPAEVNRINVESAAEMHTAVHENLANCDILFAVAAVADYKPKASHDVKIKKSAEKSKDLSLELVETVDVVTSVTSLEEKPFLVGFAAETNDVVQNAREKRIRKNLDVIVVNDVSDRSIGFDSFENKVTLIHEGGDIEIPFASKDVIAERIVSETMTLLAQSNNATTSNGSPS